MGGIVPDGDVIYGIQLPFQTGTATIAEPWEADGTPADLVAVASAAERAGCAFVSTCDHVGLPDDDYCRHMTPRWYDPIATLGFLAAHTTTTRLLTSVYIAAYRHPLASAKQFMTLDHLSGGRVIVGVGAGHVATEFAALGVDFATRGARTDECVDAMRSAFTSTYTSFEGEHFRYPPLGLEPRPAQAQIPIWIGGSSRPALRRVAERGDGWIPQGTPRAQMPAAIEAISRRRDEVRPGASIDFGFMAEWIYLGTPPFELGPAPHNVGTAEQVAASLREVRAMGVKVLHLHFRSRGLTELLDQIEAFGRDVAPLL